MYKRLDLVQSQMINRKTAKYKLFWIENKKGLEGIFLAEIWLELLIVKE